jgi:hypothetical protein
MQEVTVFFFGHGYAFQDQNKSTPSGAHVNRFIRGVQYEHGGKQSISIP